MDQIPLVRMRYTDSFVQELNRLGAPVERLLNRVNLSEEMLADRDSYIAASQLWRFAAIAADDTGNFDIGLSSGLTPLEEHSQFGQNLVYAPTLYQAFKLFCQMAPGELTNANFSLKQERDGAWFCGGPVFGADCEILQVGMYRIAMFIQLVRWAAGPEWRPRRIRLQVAALDQHVQTELIRGASLQFACPEPAIEVPSALLGRELMVAPLDNTTDPDYSAQTPVDYRDQIRQLLRTHIRNRKLGVEQLARSLDLSVRTLQRRLADHDLVFSQLVEQTRVDIARSLLIQTDQPVHQIAREVGYSESTHFSRAFRRITGNSPREFRRHNSA